MAASTIFADRVGESHVRTPVQDAAAGAQVRPHRQARDHALGRGLVELHAHQAGEQGIDAFLQRGQVGHGFSTCGFAMASAMAERNSAACRSRWS